jgi:DNA recombination protein RmuC
MALEEILFLVGDVPITYGRLFAGLGVSCLVLLLILAIVAWRGARARQAQSFEAMRRTGELEYKLAELSGSLSAFAEQVAHHDAHLARTLDERLDQVSLRLGQGLTETAERTTQSLQSLNERLAVIDNAQRNITELSTHMVSLKDILSNKQTRGAFGQGRM